ncbi:hypothetical protein CCMA1212_004991 [Trichoderma ghanense]|uniref:Uncharacterized protein n=1 Tax=Trichoderma ghanense TaxID=65468 RepID=A0ABY2H472_9HYPO
MDPPLADAFLDQHPCRCPIASATVAFSHTTTAQVVRPFTAATRWQTPVKRGKLCPEDDNRINGLPIASGRLWLRFAEFEWQVISRTGTQHAFAGAPAVTRDSECEAVTLTAAGLEREKGRIPPGS